MDIKTLVAEFADKLSALVQSHAMERARSAVLSAFGSSPPRGPGRPRKTALAKETATPITKRRRKAPRQLCPVPGCKNAAAPIFGMVCAKHQDVPKAKIKQYREARRARKLGLPAPAVRKRSTAKRGAARRTDKKVAPRQSTPSKKTPQASVTAVATPAQTSAAA